MTTVFCAPLARLQQAGQAEELRFELFGPGVDGIGTAGKNMVRYVHECGLAPTPRAWDFLSIALGVVSADDGVLRGTSPDGWTRELALTVAVSDPAFWASQSAPLQDLLAFLTGDRWELQFAEGGALPPQPDDERVPLDDDCVCLLSGGVDSLTGAITLVAQGRRPLVVSQVALGDKNNQIDFAAGIDGGLRAFQANHLIKPPGSRKELPREGSQRGRSMIFIAYGVLAASSLERHRAGQRTTLFIPENGFISINAPLTPLRLGSLSTRTTHPIYLRRLQRVLDAADLRVDMENPFRLMTKGQVLDACPDQGTLRNLVFRSTSCGRFARRHQHCGRCVPCLVRRAAFLRWGQGDTTLNGYMYNNLAINDHLHRYFDDVRSVGMAIEAVAGQGLERWLGATLDSAELGLADANAYEALVGRGLDELEVFLRQVGAL